MWARVFVSLWKPEYNLSVLSQGLATLLFTQERSFIGMDSPSGLVGYLVSSRDVSTSSALELQACVTIHSFFFLPLMGPGN